MLEAFGQKVAHLSTEDFWVWWSALAGFAAFALIFGFRRIHRAWMILGTPTARLRSAPQGYVELQGQARAMPGEPVVSPVSGTHCCWYRFWVDRRERTRIKGGEFGTRWVRVNQGASDALFLLDDGTGICVVDPDEAEVLPGKRERWHGDAPGIVAAARSGVVPVLGSGNYRFTEEVILDGHPLYALGLLRTLGGPENLGDIQSETATLLRAWKRDPHRMRQLDANGDGRVDLDEWEEARRLARFQVVQERAQRAAEPGTKVLARPADRRRPYVLAVRSGDDLARSHWLWGWSILGAFVALVGILAWMLSVRL